MTSCGVLRTQVSSIMDVLAKAAVSEICRLVDDGYAVLRLEMSRSREENEALKRKLKVMELMLAQGCMASEDRDPDRAASGDQLTAGGAQIQDPGPSGPSCGSVWRDEDSGSMADQVGSLESHLVKQEQLDDDLGQSDCHEDMKMYGKSTEVAAESASARSSVSATKTTSAEDIMELPGQHRNGAEIWEDVRPYESLKAEPENGTLSQTPQPKASEETPGKATAEGYDCVRCERTVHMEPFSTLRILGKETEAASCCSTSELTSECEPQSVPLTWSVADSCAPPGALAMKSGATRMDTDYFKIEMDLSSAWDEESRMVHTEHDVHEQPRDSESSSHTTLYSTRPPTMGRENTAAGSTSRAQAMNGWHVYEDHLSETVKTLSRGGTKVDRPICVYCGKSFSCQDVLETHQRMHTREKPFQCTQCEKRFAQLSNLIIHKRVHTGEKPYCCVHCGKQFAQSRYLVTHQRVHTGEKPFKCMQCGKRFAQSNNLIRHQSVHTGKKPFRCSQCGKCFTTSSHRKRHESVHSGKKTV